MYLNIVDTKYRFISKQGINLKYILLIFLIYNLKIKDVEN